MRNAWRVLAFDIAAPLAGIAALLAIGYVLTWPAWWVSLCSVLVLLIVEGVAVNIWLLRRDSVRDWPEQGLTIEQGLLELRSIGFSIDLAAIYWGSRLG